MDGKMPVISGNDGERSGPATGKYYEQKTIRRFGEDYESNDVTGGPAKVTVWLFRVYR